MIMGIEDNVSFILCLFYPCLQLQLVKVLFSIMYFDGFICTFCADKKYQKSLRMDAFLTPNEADDFWALRNSLG
jgi:hypothetical protein